MSRGTYRVDLHTQSIHKATNLIKELQFYWDGSDAAGGSHATTNGYSARQDGTQ